VLLETLMDLDFIDDQGKETHWAQGEQKEWSPIEGMRLLIMAPKHLKVIVGPAKEGAARLPNNGQPPTTGEWEMALDELLKDRDDVSARVGIIDERLLLIVLAFSLADAAFVAGDYVTFLEQSKLIKELKEGKGSGSNKP